MNVDASAPSTTASGIAGQGVAVVFGRRMRARCPIRDLIWIAVLVLTHQAIALALVGAAAPVQEYSVESPRFLARLLQMAALSGGLLFPAIAAALGAFAAPPLERFEETQSMLLTRLKPFDICAGNLLATLWPVTSAILASLALALSIQLARRPLPAGYGAIAACYAVLLFAAVAAGSIAMAGALRSRPGRNAVRGGAVGLLAAAGAVLALFVMNPIVRRQSDPTGIITAMITVNPSIVSASSLGTDPLRLPFLYERTDAPEYPFLYPPAAAGCGVFALAGAAALAYSTLRLKAAYR